jgi:exopolysaccharide biosynthesis predicted pyruvyltransferase EpsI
MIPIEYQMKTCSLCKLTKSISVFNKDKKAKSGYQSWCKSCIHARYYLVQAMKEDIKATTETEVSGHNETYEGQE